MAKSAKTISLRSDAHARGSLVTGLVESPHLPPVRRVSRLLAWSRVKDRVDLSRTTVWRLIQEKAFPAPARISKGRIAWLEEDIEVWITAQSSR
jgi:predicted DNA-binding transcriptional regulator AlpA